MNLLELLCGPTDTELPLRLVSKWTGSNLPTASTLEETIAVLIRKRVCIQNELIAPQLENGLMVFYVENQACYRWAYTPESSDPLVFGRESTDQQWTSEGTKLRIFLAQVAVYELVLRGDAPNTAYACSLPASGATQALTGMRQVLNSWSWPAPTTFFAGPDALAFRSGNEDCFDVGLISRSPQALRHAFELATTNPSQWRSITIEGRDIV